VWDHLHAADITAVGLIGPIFTGAHKQRH